MFDVLRNFLAEISGSEFRAQPFSDDDYRLAAVALVINIANLDGKTDAAERKRLTDLIEERFGLDARATQQLIALGEQKDRDAVDFFHFTSLLKRKLDEEGRAKVLEMMWDIAFTDGAINEFEESTIARIADLLDVSDHERVISRQRAVEASGSATAGEDARSSPEQEQSGSPGRKQSAS